MVKNPPAMQETWVQSLHREDPLEKEMTTHFSIFAWRIPWTENPGGPWGCKELDTTEQLRLWLHTFHTCYKIHIYSLTQMIWNHLQCLTVSFLTSESIVDFSISVTYWVISFLLRSGCFSVIWIQHNITKWFSCWWSFRLLSVFQMINRIPQWTFSVIKNLLNNNQRKTV